MELDQDIKQLNRQKIEEEDEVKEANESSSGDNGSEEEKDHAKSEI